MRIQRRGRVIDVIWNARPFPIKKRATVFCIRHFYIWPEGDEYRNWGGKACEECCEQWLKKIK